MLYISSQLFLIAYFKTSLGLSFATTLCIFDPTSIKAFSYLNTLQSIIISGVSSNRLKFIPTILSISICLSKVEFSS